MCQSQRLSNIGKRIGYLLSNIWVLIWDHTTYLLLQFNHRQNGKIIHNWSLAPIGVLTSKISREERKPGWKKGEEVAGAGGKGWPYGWLLPPTDTQALWDFSLGLQKREDWNSALPELAKSKPMANHCELNTRMNRKILSHPLYRNYLKYFYEQRLFCPWSVFHPHKPAYFSEWIIYSC